MPKRKSPANARSKKSRPESSPAARRRKRRTIITKVTSRTTEVRSNPSRTFHAGDFGTFVLPAAGAFLGVKALQRVVFSLVGKRYPKFAPYAAILAGAGAVGLTYAFGHKNKHTANYQDAIILGGSLATVHTAVVQILPRKYNWLVGDLSPTDLQTLPASSTTTTSNGAVTATEGDEYSYLEDDAPRTTTPKKAAAAVASAAGGKEGQFDQDLAQYLEDGESADDLYTGSFSN